VFLGDRYQDNGTPQPVRDLICELDPKNQIEQTLEGLVPIAETMDYVSNVATDIGLDILPFWDWAPLGHILLLNTRTHPPRGRIVVKLDSSEASTDKGELEKGFWDEQARNLPMMLPTATCIWQRSQKRVRVACIVMYSTISIVSPSIGALRHARPGLLNKPTSSRFLASTLMRGWPRCAGRCLQSVDVRELLIPAGGRPSSQPFAIELKTICDGAEHSGCQRTAQMRLLK
jgi:hypothetical protein